MENTNESRFGHEGENSLEREKIREIMQRSKQFIVVCGPSTGLRSITVAKFQQI